MLHKLDWLHELEIQYDTSTFDTDPFEPQPEGRHTIFPFWVPAPAAQQSEVRSQMSDDRGSAIRNSKFEIRHSAGSAGGYVELPYTLPQDSTLFILLGEKSIDIWKRKLDWLAEHGGMALVITHPDYMAMRESDSSTQTYPISLYKELLEYIRSKYEETYWHALPKDLARLVRLRRLQDVEIQTPANGVYWPSSCGGSNNSAAAILPLCAEDVAANTAQQSSARVVMLVENFFPEDTRVMNEAVLLNSAGCQVSVVCYRKQCQPSFELFKGIQVYRIPRFELFQKIPGGERGTLGLFWLRFRSLTGYFVEYLYFTSACFWNCARIFLKSGFDVIHAHNPPDTLFLVALPFKLLGKQFVFDHHDVCPELYQSRYSANRGLYTALLRAFEWCSLKLADVTIATNESYKEIQIKRGGKRADRIFVVRNGPNHDRMQPYEPAERLRRLNKAILCYIGSLNPQDGVDYLLRALDRLRHQLKRQDFYCVIMGTGDSIEDLRRLSNQLNLENCVEFTGFVSDQELMENLAAADICVDPDPSSPLNDVSTWIKVMEYMARGKPIVSFDLKETRYSAEDSALFVAPNDELAFANAIATLMDDPELRQRLGAFGRQRVEHQLQWSVTGQHLLAAYQTLFPEIEMIGYPSAGRDQRAPQPEKALL